jgi:plastocyanin
MISIITDRLSSMAASGGLSALPFICFLLIQLAQPAFAAPDTTLHHLTNTPTPISAEGVTSDKVVTAATAAEREAKIVIVDFAFAPAEITITVGQRITWVNDDGAPHGLAFSDGAKGTDLLLPAATFSRRFDRPGTYDYHCSVHPYMTGRVVVRAG